jgi:hypothetical protein
MAIANYVGIEFEQEGWMDTIQGFGLYLMFQIGLQHEELLR